MQSADLSVDRRVYCFTSARYFPPFPDFESMIDILESRDASYPATTARKRHRVNIYDLGVINTQTSNKHVRHVFTSFTREWTRAMLQDTQGSCVVNRILEVSK